MFLHGRENYRRNADLVCYTFYKNIIFSLPQFFFGFYSAFSGQTLYEKVMHQMFNVAFTGAPIVWYAIMDREFEKPKFLEKLVDAKLYKTGIKNEKFTVFVFWYWILKGVMEAYLIIVLFTSTQGLDPSNIKGRMIGHWVAGMFCFGTVEFCANWTIFMMTHNFTGYGEAIIFASAFSYFPLIALMAQNPEFSEVYKFLSESVTCVQAYFCCFMMFFVAAAGPRIKQRLFQVYQLFTETHKEHDEEHSGIKYKEEI
jgi:magnesium-transporting ATPase (P-type)